MKEPTDTEDADKKFWTCFPHSLYSHDSDTEDLIFDEDFIANIQQEFPLTIVCQPDGSTDSTRCEFSSFKAPEPPRQDKQWTMGFQEEDEDEKLEIGSHSPQWIMPPYPYS